MTTIDYTTKRVGDFNVILSSNTASMEVVEYKKVRFSLIKDEKWDDWGTLRTVFNAFQRREVNKEEYPFPVFVNTHIREEYDGKAGLNEKGEIICISAYSPIYNIGDYINNHNLHEVFNI